MRAYLLLCLLIVAFSVNAQPESGYMIFQTEGEVALLQSGSSYLNPDGRRILPGDEMTIKDGWVTFLDPEMKRVTVKKEGKLSFKELQGLFKKATASIENKYLVYMWEKMNEEEEHLSKKGGVVRGEEFLVFPFDSAVILNPEWCFEFYNPDKLHAVLLVKDKAHKVKYPIPAADSLVCYSLASSPLWPGEYYWNASIPNVPSVEDRMMIIPSEAEKSEIRQEMEKTRERLKDIPEPARTDILNEIFRMNRWVL
jgi:hypothetical protein